MPERIALLVVLFAACATPRSPAQLYQEALQATRQGDRCAYLYFEAIPPQSPERAKAERLLAEAESHYERGLALFAEAQADMARGHFRAAEEKFAAIPEAFEEGLRLAPMRPEILRRLADAYWNAGNFERAADLYRRYILLSPENKHEVDALCQREEEPFLTSDFFTRAPAEGVLAKINSPRQVWPFYVGGAASLLALILGIAVWALRRRGLFTLEEFAQRVPEAGPEIAREIACIRHELIKHRLGLTPALIKSEEQPEAREFVLARLGGDLVGDFARHVASLQRISSGRLVVPTRDPILSPLSRAVERAARTSRRLSRSPGGSRRRVERDLKNLRADLLFADRALARLVAALGQTTLDAALLRDAVASVRSEPRIEKLPLDAVTYGEVTPAPRVAIPRVDLLIVIKNLVRNALLALSSARGKRLLSLEVELRVELTGEESVLLKIRDSALRPFSQKQLEHTPAGSGLWIVQKTLGRYDGALTVEPEPEGSPFTKSLVVRLFSAM